jgi:hypothetical protein
MKFLNAESAARVTLRLSAAGVMDRGSRGLRISAAGAAGNGWLPVAFAAAAAAAFTTGALAVGLFAADFVRLALAWPAAAVVPAGLGDDLVSALRAGGVAAPFVLAVPVLPETDFATAGFAGVDFLAVFDFAGGVLVVLLAGAARAVVDLAVVPVAVLAPVLLGALAVDPRLFPADAAMTGLWLLKFRMPQ